MLIAAELRGDRRQQHRFARASRAEDQRMADIRDMQIEPEGRRAHGRGVQKRG